MFSNKKPLSAKAGYTPQLSSQNDFNDMVRDLVQAKKKSDLLVATLKL